MKTDDAKVPVHLWNDRIANKLTEHQARRRSSADPSPKAWDYSEPKGRAVLDQLGDALRGGLLHYWRRKLRTDFDVWFVTTQLANSLGSARVERC